MNLTLVIFGILMFLFVITKNFIWVLFGVMAVILLKAIILIPKMHLGAVYFLGRYIGLTYAEGWKPIIPFLMEVRAYPAKPQRLDIEVEVETKEGENESLFVKIEGNLEFYADKALMSRYRMETEETIKIGLASAIKQELNIVAGSVKGDDFISSKEEIVLIINCMLRLGGLPHCFATAFTVPENEQYESRKMRLNDFFLRQQFATDYIAPADRLKFYQTHRADIIYLLEHEAERPSERSSIEKRYGIDIRIFNLPDTDFTPEMKKAFEKKKEAEATMKGAEILTKRQEEIAKKWQEPELGLGPDAASNKADVVTGKADKHIWTVEGPVAELAKALLGFLGRSSVAAPTQEPKKSDSIFLRRRND